jgi:hypothetical protein
MRTRLRTVAKVAAVGALALLLTGCIKLNIDLQLNTDDTVSGSMIFAFDKQLLELTGQSADDVLGSSAPLPTDQPGVSSKPYDDGKYVGQEITFDSVPLTEFSTGDTESLNIVREGDTFKVTGTLDLSGGTDTGGLPTDQATQDLLAGAEIQVSVTFPGPVQDANGQIDGNTVTWNPKVGESLQIQATGSAIESSSGGSTTTILLIVGGVVVVLIIVLVVVMMSRKRKGPEVAAGGEMAAGAAPEVVPPASGTTEMGAVPGSPATPEPPAPEPPSGGSGLPPAPPSS